MNFSESLTNDEDPISIDITSLIDVVFLLLIFFMVSTTFDPSSGIVVELPKADSAAASKSEKVVSVTVSEKGEVFVGEKKLSRKALATLFLESKRENQNTQVVVRADQKSTHGVVVSVMDLAKQAGIDALSIATAKN